MLFYHMQKPGSKPYRAIFMFHGWGRDEKEMQNFFPLFEQKGTLLVAFKAPYWREKPRGYSWFTMEKRVRDAFVGCQAQDIRFNQLVPALKAEEEKIKQSVKKICKEHDIQEIHFIGFSQGAMMALYTGLKMKAQNIVSIAGYGVYELLDEIATIESRILLLTGDKDKIVRPSYQYHLYDYFKNRNADVSLETLPYIQHIPLSAEIMKKASAFTNATPLKFVDK